jgi:hypothetical protein
VYWYDSCGQRGAVKQQCKAGTTCVDDACCAPAKTSGTFTLPAHTIWIGWQFAKKSARLEFKLRIVNDPGESVGLYLAPFNGKIDGTSFYLGLQTTINKPSVGRVGKGLIFSRWGTQDPKDGRTAPGGFMEVSDHEGQFVGVRQTYKWTKGDYTVRLQRAESDGAKDWFDLYIEDSAGKATYIGGLRFPRNIGPSTPAGIGISGTTFTEVYWGATDYGKVPAWHTAIMASADGAAPTAAKIEYPAWPTAEYPNADAYLDDSDKLIHLVFGGGTMRCHAAGAVLP